MRPVHLTMTAFGSYAETTEVPFDRLNGGLYLIVGKTGSGKTTIFDAICFALFGEASGTDRRADLLHSDYVDPGVDTVVRFTFSHGGRRYTVERRLHCSKKRGAEGYQPPKPFATLREEDRPPIEGASRVTERCRALLGLNVEQFRRIVMLAQGEFREFLRADSSKKNDILGRLFDSGDYVRFQSLLEETRSILAKRRETGRQEIHTVMETLFQPPAGNIDPTLYLPDHPQLARTLSDLVAEDSAALEALKARRLRRQEITDVLLRQAGAAKRGNMLLEELSRQETHRRALEEQRAGTAARRSAWVAAEAALRRVQPAAEELQRSESALRRAQADLKQSEAQLSDQEIRLLAAQTAAETDNEQRGILSALQSEIHSLAAALPRYDELANKRRLLQLQQEQAEAAAALLLEKKTRQQTLTRELDAIRSRLAETADAEASVVRAQAIRDTAQARLELMTAAGTGIQFRLESLKEKERRRQAACARLEELTQAASAAETHYHSLYQAFLRGQAGLIAQDMRAAISEAGRAVCPVCGSVVCRGQEAHLAVPPEETPSRQALEEAESSRGSCEEARREKQLEAERLRSEIDGERRGILAELQRLSPGLRQWEDLSEAALTALAGQLRQQSKAAEAALAEALAQQDVREGLLQNVQTYETAVAPLSGETADLSARHEKHLREAEVLAGAIEEMKKQLPLADRAAAEAELERMNGSLASLQQQMEARRQSLEAVKARFDELRGGIQQQKDALPGLGDACDAAAAKYRAALQHEGFSNTEAYLAALPPVSGAEGENWLETEKTLLDSYDADVAATDERIDILRQQTKDLSAVDIAALEEMLTAAEAARDEAADACQRQEQLLHNHTAVYRRVAAALEELQHTQSAWRRIDELATLAVGASAEGGKLSFDRYVMGTIFREVLDMANRRLDIMTGGQLTLLHSMDAGRRNASSGLEIDVLDMSSGRRREAATVSGGESFMVSLALALGLSDMAQQHAGGRQLDALFIDEGFGSLDDGKLDNVISVLNQLTDGHRLVGIISHVDKLEESIPQKLRVTRTDAGSTLALELS